MTTEEQTLREIQETIDAFAPMRRQHILTIAKSIQMQVEAFGEDGRFAIALEGARLAAEAP
jgi:hypothetical protein